MYKRGNATGADRERPKGLECGRCGGPRIGPRPQTCRCTAYGATEPEARTLVDDSCIYSAAFDSRCLGVELQPLQAVGQPVIYIDAPRDMPLTQALEATDVLIEHPAGRPWSRVDIASIETNFNREDGDFCRIGLAFSL